MSPETSQEIDWFNSFPRVSGDEPISALAQAATPAFSPRERG